MNPECIESRPRSALAAPKRANFSGPAEWKPRLSNALYWMVCAVPEMLDWNHLLKPLVMDWSA